MDKDVQLLARFKSLERGLYLTLFVMLTIIQLFTLGYIPWIKSLPFSEVVFMLISFLLIYILFRVKVTVETLDELSLYRLRLFIEIGFHPFKKSQV